MKLVNKICSLSALLVAGLIFTSCGNSTQEESGKTNTQQEETSNSASNTEDNDEIKSVDGQTVAFIPKLTGNAFFEAANKGAQEYAEKWGINVDYMGDSSASVSAQVAVINQAIAKGVDSLCISSVDAAGLSDALKEATDAGITVTTWDSDALVGDRTIMVSQGTPEILAQMLIDMSIEGLKQRGIDPEKDEVKYTWHYSQATVKDQNSWKEAGEKIIEEKYPNWVNIAPDSYFSEQDAEKAINVGEAILEANTDIDLIICNDSTSLPGQLQAAENKGLSMDDITITGFSSPNPIKQFAENKTIYNWGLWDCGLQGAIGCYVSAYLGAGNQLNVGDKINIPEIGEVEVLENDSIEEGATTGETNNGVVLIPERLVFTTENMNDYDF